MAVTILASRRELKNVGQRFVTPAIPHASERKLPLSLPASSLKSWKIRAYDPTTASRLWQELWDRAWRKAPALAAIEGRKSLGLDAIDLEIQAIAEALRAEREKGRLLPYYAERARREFAARRASEHHSFRARSDQ